MLETIVLVAEVLVFIWFSVFSIMLLSMYLDSRNMPKPVLSGAGRVLVSNARVAFGVGLVALTVLTIWEIARLPEVMG
ncbi:hypothetical protein [Roseibium sp. RKSG952]|uniref:hypothetical protein n=1 Tax=Roseibium sp. RKSG952 TaxID=2529384 RepID=UPI0012BB7A95|nr:hypothetical protein [Roseibium sp. RKSG952]MTI00636.1 hypothetical protein [Roseibium sp. RKSG952]